MRIGNIENLRHQDTKPNKKNKEKLDKKSREDIDLDKRDTLKKLGKIAALSSLAVLTPGILNNEDESEKSKKIETKEMNENEKVAYEMFRLYNSKAIQDCVDKDVFTSEFLLAQEFQESRCDPEAVSSAGGKGVLQCTPVATQEIVKYLSFLKDSTKDMDDENKVDYTGPELVSESEADKIGDYYKEAECGRAAGRLYSQSIHDERYKYNTRKNRDIFRGKTVEKQQELLLLSYHDGPGIRYHPEDATNVAKESVVKVRKFMKHIVDLRQKLEHAGMPRDLDEAIIEILKELDRKKGKEYPEEVKLECLKKLQEAHMEKWRKLDSVKARLTNDEIKELFS